MNCIRTLGARSEMKRAAIATVSIATTVGALQACAALFNIDDRPLVREAGPLSDVASGIDAGPDAGANYCSELQPPPDFCDEFEHPVNPAQGWSLGELITGTSTLEIEDDPTGSAHGRVLVARAESQEAEAGSDSENDMILALIGHELGPATAPAGIRIRARIRLRAMVLGPPQHGEAGEDLTRPIGAFLALTGKMVDPPGQGIALALARDENNADRLTLSVLQRQIVATKLELSDSISDRLIEFGITGAGLETIPQTKYLDYQIAIGAPETLQRHGLGCGDAGAFGDAAAIVRFDVLAFGGCAATRGPLAGTSWFSAPILGTGAGALGDAKVEIGIDAIAVNFLD
jgi:hypothetical protein